MKKLLHFIMSYNKINNLLGWLCFTLASLTYILTLEPSVSFWDCGEFISCAYKLQVSHQPGYPLFAMIGKAFSLLSMGDRTKVAYFTNLGSALASGATIMFLFWSITALAKKLLAIKCTPVNTTQTLQSAQNSGGRLTLPDGTQIFMAPNSKITYTNSFNTEKRELTLIGEAFFDVKHRSHQSFVVHTGELQTRDIGTSFKISAFKN